jgi:hypothetical protein
MLDLGTLLFPQSDYTGNQTGTPLLLYPRQLPTCAWVIQVTVAPSASCLFTLAVATGQGGPFSAITSFTWPVGETGRRQVQVGLQGNMAALLNNQAVWLRAAIATGGTVSCSSWLSTMTDGFGLGNKPGTTISVV